MTVVLLCYAIGLIFTGVVYGVAFNRMSEEERAENSTAAAVVLIFLWPLLWIAAGIMGRREL